TLRGTAPRCRECTPACDLEVDEAQRLRSHVVLEQPCIALRLGPIAELERSIDRIAVESQVAMRYATACKQPLAFGKPLPPLRFRCCGDRKPTQRNGTAEPRPDFLGEAP